MTWNYVTEVHKYVRKNNDLTSHYSLPSPIDLPLIVSSLDIQNYNILNSYDRVVLN